ncbi:hypothetical protein JAAARDRAFT_48934 [Jaapia argillacea MUCL 33604]|uniref:Uncharacterized protein n=1 Tax=Jaapia argillacea MUCL 33604 TaxID=933084 RepID=A0A067PK55_9AGAM|nr:hypothetical protein JAAARDRAFT_48934 [Jaapia argillacea MUCL 33604]
MEIVLVALPKPKKSRHEEKNLPVPFRQTYRRWTKQDIQRAKEHGPLKHLTLALLPSTDPHIQPPTLHLGWPLNKALVKRYAEKYQIVVDLDNKGVITEEQKEEDINPIGEFLDNMREVLGRIAKEAGADAPSIHLEWVLREGNKEFVSLCSNYDILNMPEDEDLERLQKIFEEPEMAKWYLDLSRLWWQYS